MIPIKTIHATYAAQLFSASLMALVSLSAPSLMDAAQLLADHCPSLYL